MGSIDLGAIARWGANKAIGAIEQKVGIPMQEPLGPLIEKGIEAWGLSEAVMLGVPELAMLRLFAAGVMNQQKLREARNVPK